MRWSFYLGKVTTRFIHLAYIMYIHQKFGLSPSKHIVQYLLRFLDSYIMTLRYDRMSINFCWPFNDPIAGLLGFKSTFITYPVLHFTPLILSGCYTKDFISAVPERGFPLAFRTISVGVDRIQKPDSVFETKCFVR